MKKIYTVIRFIVPALLVFLNTNSYGQCTNYKLDWDYRAFFGNSGTISSYVTTAQCQSQRYAFGDNVMTVTHNYSGSSAVGDNSTHTGEAGSFGAGADIQFMGNGNLTFTFQNPVSNVQFSLYDIDLQQRAIVTASLFGFPSIITSINNVSGSILSVSGSGTFSGQANASNNSCNNASTDGTVNVTINGPITSFSIVISNTSTCSGGCSGVGGSENGSFWISDIAACSSISGTAFPSNYFNVSKPYTGQDAYVLAIRNDSVYYVSTTTGVAKFLFADYGHTNMNSMAYDPIRHFVYYTYSLTGGSGGTNPNDKTLRRYDYEMDTLGIVTTNVPGMGTTGGIPTLDEGVESGAAAFYNGSLYLGIENGINNQKSTVWKIDFNGSYQPTTTSQLYAQTSVSGGTRIHDWADFSVTNGKLYDFDGGNISNTNADFWHMDLSNGTVTNVPTTMVPRQSAVDWNGQVYNIGAGSSGTKGVIAPYNYAGNITAALEDTITFKGVKVTGSWGDGAEAFKPKVDFGDAPASYDPASGDPAVHEMDTTLRLGVNMSMEFASRGQTVNANSDTYEDGLGYVPILTPGGNYYPRVTVWNNTGSPATLTAWLDYNKNGKFDPSEGLAPITVPSTPAYQQFYLFWPAVSTTLVPGQYTFMRIRITSQANGMTQNNPTGFYDIGEVEDYRVNVDNFPLPVNLTSFKATKTNEDRVDINWSVVSEDANTTYVLERSAEGQNWSDVYQIIAPEAKTSNSYSYADLHPVKNTSYYRLRIKKETGAYSYSSVQRIDFNAIMGEVKLHPNPNNGNFSITINASKETNATITITDISGKITEQQKVFLQNGVNVIPLQMNKNTSSGVYAAKIQINDQQYIQKIIVNK